MRFALLLFVSVFAKFFRSEMNYKSPLVKVENDAKSNILADNVLFKMLSKVQDRANMCAIVSIQ